MSYGKFVYENNLTGEEIYSNMTIAKILDIGNLFEIFRATKDIHARHPDISYLTTAYNFAICAIIGFSLILVGIVDLIIGITLSIITYKPKNKRPSTSTRNTVSKRTRRRTSRNYLKSKKYRTNNIRKHRSKKTKSNTNNIRRPKGRW